jgi:hypothetical protein
MSAITLAYSQITSLFRTELGVWAPDPPLVGVGTTNRETLTAAYLTPSVETQFLSNGNILYRICTNSTVLIKLKDQEN